MLDATPATLEGDPVRLRQLVTILADNAIRHSPPGTAVQVAVAVSGRQAELTVDDAGPGVRPEDRAHIFERFWRAADAPPGGVGLGLAIASWIVRRHGGTITVDSSPAEGARFDVLLPLAGGGPWRRGTPARRPSRASRASRSAPGERPALARRLGGVLAQVQLVEQVVDLGPEPSPFTPVVQPHQVAGVDARDLAERPAPEATEVEDAAAGPAGRRAGGALPGRALSRGGPRAVRTGGWRRAWLAARPRAVAGEGGGAPWPCPRSYEARRSASRIRSKAALMAAIRWAVSRSGATSGWKRRASAR